ncbi:MAG: cell envelope integrity protein TolA [Verrucomicrobiales bacterium]|nr:cell envelope integrity protein TolA [Verrucomicrobiales bacterium]
MTLLISVVSTLLIRADQILTKETTVPDPATIDPPVIEPIKIEDEIEPAQDQREDLLLKKIDLLTERINELEKQLKENQDSIEKKLTEKSSDLSVKENPQELGPSSDLFPEDITDINEQDLPEFVPDNQAREDFGEALNPYGDWLSTDNYGEVWRPNTSQTVDWSPYTVGQWNYTELGWHFTSPEPWGWACYHYGRWVRYRTLGWCWVPGREWAPAWVSWRTSSNHIGWSPLPPTATWSHSIGIRRWVDSRCNIGPSHYNFVKITDFVSRNCRTSVINRRQNASLILSTNNVTLILSSSSEGNNHIHSRGPNRDYLVRHHQQKHPTLHIVKNRGKRGAINRTNHSSNHIVIHERIKSSHSERPNNRPASRKIHKVEVDNGWNELANHDQEKKLRRHIHNDSEKEKNQDRPVNQRPDNNKIKAVSLINETNTTDRSSRISETKIPNIENHSRRISKETNDRIQSNVIVPPISKNKTPKAIPIKENNPGKQRQTVQARQQQEIAAAKRIADDKAKQNQIAQKQAAEQKQRQTVQARQQQEIAAAKRIADDRARRNQFAQKQAAEQRQRQAVQRKSPTPKTSSNTIKQSPQRRIVRGSSERTPKPAAKQSRKR